MACSNCGRPICPDCMTVTPVGMRCPECARERTQVRRIGGGLRTGAAPATYALIAINVAAFLVELAGGGAASIRGGGDGDPRRRPERPDGRRRRGVANRHRRVPARRVPAHRAQHVRPLHPRHPARAGDRHAALPGRLFRLPAGRLLRGAAAGPERDHGGRLRRDLRPHVRGLHRRPAPGPGAARLADRLLRGHQPGVHLRRPGNQRRRPSRRPDRRWAGRAR